MEMFRPLTAEPGGLAGWGVSVLLVALLDGGLVARRLAALGARVTVLGDLEEAMAALLGREAGFDLLVIDCDHVGGMQGAGQAYARLCAAGVCLPVMLISAACREQIFPVGLEGPFHLRAPLSGVALRIGFELAFSRLAVGAPDGKRARP